MKCPQDRTCQLERRLSAAAPYSDKRFSAQIRQAEHACTLTAPIAPPGPAVLDFEEPKSHIYVKTSTVLLFTCERYSHVPEQYDIQTVSVT